MRAFFADGVDKMPTHWAVEGLPMLLHISLVLSFGGIVIYLYNINHEIFLCHGGLAHRPFLSRVWTDHTAATI